MNEKNRRNPAGGEKVLRIKYIRALEKFTTRTIALLKKEDFDLASFKEKVTQNFQAVKDTKEVRLDSGYMQKLKAYVDHIIESLDSHSESYEKERAFLLKEANLLHKEKSRNNYKKEKHKKAKFDDGY